MWRVCWGCSCECICAAARDVRVLLKPHCMQRAYLLWAQDTDSYQLRPHGVVSAKWASMKCKYKVWSRVVCGSGSGCVPVAEAREGT